MKQLLASMLMIFAALVVVPASAENWEGFAPEQSFQLDSQTPLVTVSDKNPCTVQQLETAVTTANKNPASYEPARMGVAEPHKTNVTTGHSPGPFEVGWRGSKPCCSIV